MTINETYQEIVHITQEIIAKGLSIDEKWPSRSGSKISWHDQQDLSIALKNIPYSDKYNVLKKDRNFNFKMLDGALIQMMYHFDAMGKTLLSHRLAFFPSPHSERYDDDPEGFEEKYFGDSEFHDMIEKNIVAFPIRFDYNVDPKMFMEIEHPFAHATLGEYEFCRIPIDSPLSPSSFIHFILRNFYNYAYQKKGLFCTVSGYRFSSCITAQEKSIIHFNLA